MGRASPRPLAVAVVVLLVAPATGCLDALGRLPGGDGGPGDRALDYLTDSTFTKLVVEVQSVQGSDPNPEALQRLKDNIAAHLKKPGGVTYDTSGLGVVPGKGQNGKYTWKEIQDIERDHRKHRSRGDTAALYVLYLDGGSQQDSGNNRVLGAVYSGSSIVMFKGNVKSISRSDGGIIPGISAEERCVERAVLVHELGHVLGLVNHPLPQVREREDPESPGHSKNKGSVMYHAIENSQSLLNIFGGGCSQIPYQFDNDDKADLRAAGGK